MDLNLRHIFYFLFEKPHPVHSAFCLFQKFPTNTQWSVKRSKEEEERGEGCWCNLYRREIMIIIYENLPQMLDEQHFPTWLTFSYSVIDVGCAIELKQQVPLCKQVVLSILCVHNKTGLILLKWRYSCESSVIKSNSQPPTKTGPYSSLLVMKLGSGGEGWLTALLQTRWAYEATAGTLIELLAHAQCLHVSMPVVA